MKRLRLAVLVAALLAVVLATVLLSGCSAGDGDAAAEQKARCFQNEKLIKVAMDVFYADSQLYPPISSVVTKLDVKCPSGGVYSFDPNTDTVTCSVHGHP